MQDTYTLSGTRDAVAQAVRIEMARRNITQTKLAALAGMKPQYLSRRMTADTAFDTDDLTAIAKALSVPITTLLPVEAAA